MSIIAPKFSTHKWNFFWQPLVATGFVTLTLAALGVFKQTGLLSFIGTSSLGASAFLIFTMPSARSAKISRMLCAYLFSIIIGVACVELLHGMVAVEFLNFANVNRGVTAALAIAITMFVMALFGFEHPPAAGFALGIVVEPWAETTLLIMIMVILLLGGLKFLLRQWLVDLV